MAPSSCPEYRAVPPQAPSGNGANGANETSPQRGGKNAEMGGPLTAPLQTIPTGAAGGAPPPNDVANGIALQEAFAEIGTTVSGATGRGAGGSWPLAAKSLLPCATHIESCYRQGPHKPDLSDVDAHAQGKSDEGAQDMLEPILGRETECGGSQTYIARTVGMQMGRFTAIEESTSIDASVVVAGSAGPLGACCDLIMSLL